MTESPSASSSRNAADHGKISAAEHAPISRRVSGPLVVLLALAAGVGAWYSGEQTHEYFQPSEEAASQNYTFAALNREMEATTSYNGALAFGALGGLLGLALGVAGGMCRKSLSGLLIGAGVGLVLGVIAGALPALGIIPWQWRHRNDDPSTASLVMPLIIHLGLWSGVGLAGGISFAIGYYGWKPAKLLEAGLAGLLGAMIGTFLFDITGALFFPLAQTAYPISLTRESRLLARLLVTGCVALVLLRALPASSKPITSTAAAPAAPKPSGS